MHKSTYGDLENALVVLGFTVKTGVNGFGRPVKTYEHPQTDAWIGLRGAPLDEPLRQVDLMSDESAVVWKGVATSERFHKLLEKQGAAVKARAS